MKYLLPILAFGYFITSCTKDQAPPPECPVEISFAQEVKPMIDLNCSTSGCHDATAQGGVILTNYSQISANANTILSVIKHETGVTPMPYFMPKLSDSTINMFKCWVKQGALDN